MTQQVRIVKFQPHHLLGLELQEEQKHFFDLFQCASDIMTYGQGLNDNAVDTDDNEKCSWTGMIGDKVIGCGGIVRVSPHMGEAWTLLSDDFKKYAHRAAPEIKRQASIARAERVFALVDDGFERAERFMKWIGFEYEGTLRKVGTHKQDQKMYSRIREI